jgi:hypothetical protein
MSDLPIDYRDQLNLREQIARIDRALVENEKLQAETRKLLAESRKYSLDPWMVLVGAVIAAIALRLPEIMHALGAP